MTARNVVTVAILGLILGSTPFFAKTVEVRAPAGADVSQHATYGWMPTPSGTDANPFSPRGTPGSGTTA